MPPEPKNRVKLMDLGDGRGKAIPITRSQIEDLGLDPDEAIEASRSVLGDDAIRSRLYAVDDDRDD
ncbi:MAG: hypothetical protein SV760_09610 [Halobacteria archaeon]|nr:hypothetical protein [Halobacteria archaeon]